MQPTSQHTNAMQVVCLEDAASAHAYMESNSNFGKIILTMAPR